MLISTYLEDLVVWAPAKVNLFLEVLGNRPDGYHEIATLMVAVRLFDTLVFRESADLTLRCSDSALSAGRDNLVLKAAQLLRQRTGCSRGAQIRLIKRIPMAAGLAGGSTDAAATLLGLNRLWQLGLSAGDLAKLSAEIGSDIPFFFSLPAAWCTGRGEIVEAVKPGKPLEIILVCPPFGLSTAEVYKKVVVSVAPESGQRIRAAFIQGDVDLLGRFMHNRLQLAAEALDPRIAEYARLLKDAQPAGALMSGSGSTLFAVCRSAEETEQVAARVRADVRSKGSRVYVTRSL